MKKHNKILIIVIIIGIILLGLYLFYPVNVGNYGVTKNKFNIFYLEHKIESEEVDVKTFEKLGNDPFHYKDKNNIYRLSNEIFVSDFSFDKVENLGNFVNLDDEEIVKKITMLENNKSCEIDSDCVPASCCHSTDVVNKENAPSCENLKCTASCETILDCGHGKPVCNEGQCEIEINEESDLRDEKSGDLEDIKEINGECAKEGKKFAIGEKKFDVVQYPYLCCDGLKAIKEPLKEKDGINILGECYYDESVDYEETNHEVGECINCGDGFCSDIENSCNCFEDCGSDYDSFSDFCKSQDYYIFCGVDYKDINHNVKLCDMCEDYSINCSPENNCFNELGQ